MIPPDKPIFSHSSPCRILAILDWDFGGSHALQLADKYFEVRWPDLDDVQIKDGEEIDCFQTLINQLAGALPFNMQLNLSTMWHVLNLKPSGRYTCAMMIPESMLWVGFLIYADMSLVYA